MTGAPRAAGRYGIRPVRQPRVGCVDLRLLPGRAVSPDWHAIGADAGARRRTASVGQHAADRHGGRSAGEFTSRRMSMNWRYCCATPSISCSAPDGSSVWLRLSTRQFETQARTIDADAVIAGAHWVVPPVTGAQIAIGYQGPVAPEAVAAFTELQAEEPGAGPLAITSPGWTACRMDAALRARRKEGGAVDIEGSACAARAGGRVGDGAGWSSGDARVAGIVRGQRLVLLGPDHFGQSGDIPDLYREYESIRMRSLMRARRRCWWGKWLSGCPPNVDRKCFRMPIGRPAVRRRRRR